MIPLRIALDEWRYWARSRLALTAAALMAVVMLSTTIVTVAQVDAERASREQLQADARAAFLAQPARHPHRMVHYGHYVFRVPTPLAAFDPGIDPLAGQSVFLEGHRQNTATFPMAGTGSRLGSLHALTPASVYQFFVPLLLIILGFGTITREREASTLVPLLMQGATAASLVTGKLIALAAAAFALSVPSASIVLVQSARPGVLADGLAVLLVCLVYLLAWCVIIVCVSAWCRSSQAALTVLTALWVTFSWIVPSVAVDVAARSAPQTGKIGADLVMLANMRSAGDGHNAGDPAYARLRADLLAQYGAASPDELPVNLRGVVAEYAEEKLTRILNEYADARMSGEIRQSEVARLGGWLSPALAFGATSRALVGTSLEDHHRFLRDAEALRYDFVQALNRLHAQRLAYSDDVARSRDPNAERRTRIDPAAWQVLDEFRGRTPPLTQRLHAATPSIAMLLWWILLPATLLTWIARRIESSP
jgi:ABC-2 type transport system permease protein